MLFSLSKLLEDHLYHLVILLAHHHLNDNHCPQHIHRLSPTWSHTPSPTICKQYDIFCSGLHNLSISFVNNIVFESFIYWSKGIDSTQWNLHHSSKNHPQALNKQNPVRLTNRLFFLKYFSDWQTEAKFREKYFSDQASFGRSWWRTGMKIKVLVKTSMWT